MLDRKPKNMSHNRAEYSDIKPENNARAKKNTREKRERRPPKKITSTYLHNSGLYYLERFAASKKHFKTVMMRKVKRSCMHHKDQDYNECAILVDALVNKFEKSGLLNDDLYTSGSVSSLRRKGLSRMAIISKMLQKGIAKDQTLLALEKLDYETHESCDDAERAAALNFARKKRIGPYFRGNEQNIKKSLGVLARGGFSYSVAMSILEMNAEDVDMTMY